MSTTLDGAAFDAFLKETYPDIRCESLAKKGRPLLEYFPRHDDFYGDAYAVPVLYEDPQGRSRDAATAIANAENSKQVKFVGTDQIEDYGVVNIGGKVMMQASKDVGSFIKARSSQIDGMLRTLGKSLHIALYRSGSGSIGQLHASTGITGSGLILELTNPSDVHYFGVGQTLIANATDDDVTMKTGGVKVVKRSVSAGTLTVDVNVTTLGTAWANSDYLFTEGDQAGKVTGLDGWLPIAEPGGSDSFFTVNRSQDVSRLAGQREISGSGDIADRLQELAVLIDEEGGEPDTIFMNPRDGLTLATELGVEVRRTEGDRQRFGFDGFTMVTFVGGPKDVVFDAACPIGKAYMLQKDTWRLAHMGPVPHIIRDSGSDAQQATNADAIQVRGRYFCELFCEAPGKNGVCDVS